MGVVKRIGSIEGVGREDQDAIQKRCGQSDNFSEVGLSKEGWAPSSHLGYGQVGTRSLGGAWPFKRGHQLRGGAEARGAPEGREWGKTGLKV